MTCTVTLVPILDDNYSYILHSESLVAVIDPGEAAPVIQKLEDMGLTPDYILNTHHHGDHISGNGDIIARYGAKLIAPASEQKRIHGIDRGVSESDIIHLNGTDIKVFETPAHTTGHICFYLPHEKILFSGDLLFAMGCGRTFEGTADQMYHSIQKIKSLPPETKIYCGHEYTLSNAKFCIHVAPENDAIKARYKNIKDLREANIPTIPTTLIEELETNVFMIAESAEEFSSLRAQKDKF